MLFPLGSALVIYLSAETRKPSRQIQDTFWLVDRGRGVLQGGLSETFNFRDATRGACKVTGERTGNE